LVITNHDSRFLVKFDASNLQCIGHHQYILTYITHKLALLCKYIGAQLRYQIA